MMFFAPDAGGGEGGGDGGEGELGTPGTDTLGGAALTPPAKISSGEKPLPKAGEKPNAGKAADVGKAPDGSGTPEAETKPPTEPFDVSKFAQEFGDKIGAHLEKVAKPPEKELTEAEARTLLNFWDPDENWYKEFDNLETRSKAIGSMRDGIVRHIDTINQLRVKEAIDKLREEFGPQLKAASEVSENQQHERLGKAYPDLVKPELAPLVNAITEDLKKQGKKYANEGEFFKALAGGVEAVIKVNNPDFKLATNNGSQEDTKGRSDGEIPVTTPGSGGGAGRTEGKKPEKSRGIAVFEK